MKWVEVIISCNKDNVEDVSVELLDAGATGTQIIDPNEIKNMINELSKQEYADDRLIPKTGFQVIAYYNLNQNLVLIKKKYKEKISTQIVDDVNWKDNWKKYYVAFNITESIRIIPSWDKQLVENKLDIIMEPGMAFGTGTHETTKLCAKLLEEYIVDKDKVIDVGCGTGILSIIAKKLGASEVTAIDIDDSAVKTTNENIIINETPKVNVVLGELKDIKESKKYNIIIANIVSDIIIKLTPDFKNYLVKEGKIICSGIILSRKDDVVNSLKTNGFTIIDIKTDNEWVAIVAHA
ncbi:MAG: 50S ribosomal protein L11 methyltransferase [Clostridiales bacterium]|nr:50S ribosomal protein L11 methyltransferase [Clostridiales bacterium]